MKQDQRQTGFNRFYGTSKSNQTAKSTSIYQSTKPKFADLDQAQLMELSNEQSQRTLQIICEFQHSLKNNSQLQTEGLRKNAKTYSFVETEFNDSLKYITEWRIDRFQKCLLYFSQNPFSHLFGINPHPPPKTSFYQISHIKFPQLKIMKLRNKKDIEFRTLQYPESFSKLENLEFSSCAFEDLKSLLILPLQKLKRLCLNDDDIQSISFLKEIEFENLEILSLTKNELTQASFYMLTIPKVQKLILDQNKFTSLKFIQTNNFPHLKILNLCRNYIASVECLAHTFLPTLQLLNLSWNKITNIRPIRRMNMQNLKELSINGNPILQLHSLSEIHCKYCLHFLNKTDKYIAISILAKIPANVSGSYQIFLESDTKQNTFNRLFGIVPDNKDQLPAKAKKSLAKRNLTCIQNKLLPDFSHY